MSIKDKAPLFIDEKVQKIIETIVGQKKAKYAFVGTDEDDIAQEIRIKAWEILPKYDPSKGQSLEAFLSVCIDNKLKNYKRDKFVKYIPPCVRNSCPLFDKVNKDCLLTSLKDPHSNNPCIPYANYMKRMQKKVMVKSPISYNTTEWGVGVPEPEIKDGIMLENELDRLISERLKRQGQDLFEAYKLMLANCKAEVSTSMRKKVRWEVEEIIKRLKDEGVEW